MRVEPRQAPTPGGIGRGRVVLLGVLVSTTMVLTGPPVLASDAGDDPSAAQHQSPAQNSPPESHQPQPDHAPEPSPSPSTASGLCEALASAATTNDLPVDFFTRLIWQESRFKPDAVSPKGAQGIAQFMPATARSRGLENPFDPLEAVAKSSELLSGLRQEFGNLGLAAAAYNAGSGRVHDWLDGRRSLPGETRAYVRFVTGHSVEEWAEGHTDTVKTPPVLAVPCNLPATASIEPRPHASAPKAEVIKPWGVEVVGAPTPAKALARYREWQSKYTAILADREPHVIIRGILGQMGAARVRVGDDTRVGASKLCAALRAAGTYCEVFRN